MYTMPAIPHQGMGLFVPDPVVVAAWVRAKVAFRGNFLLWPAFAFPQQPGDWHFRVWRLLFPLVFLAKAAVALAFGVKDGGFSSSFGFLLL